MLFSCIINIYELKRNLSLGGRFFLQKYEFFVELAKIIFLYLHKVNIVLILIEKCPSAGAFIFLQ